MDVEELLLDDKDDEVDEDELEEMKELFIIFGFISNT